MNYLAFGHSHIVALAKGAYAMQARGVAVGGTTAVGSFHYLYDESFQPEVTDSASGPVLHAKILGLFAEVNPGFVVLSVGGNEHNVLSIAGPERPFDFILGEQPDLPLDRRREILPEAAVRETLRDWMKNKTAIMRAMRHATSVPMIQAEPPPPLPREQVLAYPKEFFRGVMGRHRLSPDVIRHKMWRLQTSLYREVCAETGIAYAPVPADLVGTDGMLPRSSWGQDATHANEAFGQRIMQEVFGRAENLLSRGGER